MKDEVLGKFLIYFLLILIATQPSALLIASQDEKKETSNELSFQNFHTAAWVSPSASPFVHFEFEKEEHTHQEDKSPQQYRYTLESSLGTASVSPSSISRDTRR